MPESIFGALLAGRPEALRLLPGRFRDPDAWRAAAQVAATRRPASALLEELARQSRALPESAARTRNLEDLARPGTTVVVTGQQVGLFGGPLYTLHKAATAIARARMLAASTGKPCVPLFWLQTEDHDYAEIAHVTLPSPHGPLALALPDESSPSRVSIAHRVLPADVEALVAQVESSLASLPHAAELVALLRAHYRPGQPIAAAFAGMLAELWKDEGLLILDPRVPAVAQLAAPIMRRALEEHSGIAADLAARAAAIGEAGFEEQVHTRQNAALVFFHPESASGARYRLVRARDSWETPAGTVSHAALLALLAQEPMRFSTSALLRPLVQDAILPASAYVGGPAELAYFAQLLQLYARFEMTMPMIAPRARLRVLDPTTRSLLNRTGLDAAACEHARDTVLARVAARPGTEPSAAELRQRMLEPLQRELDALAARKLEGLENPIKKAREACAAAIEKLAAKAERAALARDQIANERVDRLLAELHPSGVAQERAYGFVTYAARCGTRALLSAVLDAASSLDPSIRDVCP
jgi:bacillithiol biosynthesis cysteine-adding enzyme BshC